MTQIFLFTFLTSASFASHRPRSPHLVTQGVSTGPYSEFSTPLLNFDDLTINQKLSITSTQTFGERAFFSDTFADDANSPVIYYLCGEWECSEDEIDVFVGAMAQTLHAYVVGVEHRFYGQSLPNVNHVSDLATLTSANALADFAEVERWVIAQFHLKGPWISYGGSYAGTLSAYYRILYPDLVQGAIASSPPLEITPRGLLQYEVIAENAFGTTLSSKVRIAVHYILEQSKTNDGKAWIKENFKTPDTNFTPDDISAILVGTIPTFAQYAMVKNLSQALVDGQSPSQAATALAAVLRSAGGDDFWSESAYGLRQDAKLQSGASRWIYQAYHEFGWLYVTAPVAPSLFPGPLDMNYYANEDGKIFSGIALLGADQFPLKMLSKLTSTASRIVMINGTIDPWMATSFSTYQDAAREISSYIVLGGDHCPGFEMPAAPVAGTPTFTAQTAIYDAVRRWTRVE